MASLTKLRRCLVPLHFTSGWWWKCSRGSTSRASVRPGFGTKVWRKTVKRTWMKNGRGTTRSLKRGVEVAQLARVALPRMGVRGRRTDA